MRWNGSTMLRLTGAAMLLLLAGCSRSSLLGGPGPEAAHHASPASSERLALLEAGKKFKSKDGCRQHLLTLAHASSPNELVRISDNEVRGYHSTGQGAAAVHHEYSCVGEQFMERSWTGSPAQAHGAARHGAGHEPAEHEPESHEAEEKKPH